jgi:type IV pilus assembly protein PilX
MSALAPTSRSTTPARTAQRGVALVIALILLVIGTLIGLAAIRNTTLQERMSANMYDRSLAFQRAEAALRAAEVAVTSNWKIADLNGVDCTVSGSLCSPVPANAFTGTNGNWVTVTSNYDVNDSKTSGAPQYHIQFMGTGNAQSALGLEANADFGNYGGAYPPDNVAYYRITARSSAPADAGEQAIVVLQSTIKRPY